MTKPRTLAEIDADIDAAENEIERLESLITSNEFKIEDLEDENERYAGDKKKYEEKADKLEDEKEAIILGEEAAAPDEIQDILTTLGLNK